MIKKPEVYKNFPLKIVLYRAALLLSTIVVGGIVSFKIGLIALLLYVIVAATANLWTMKNVCRNCAYHGKRCDLGVSLLAGYLHRDKGNIQLFNKNIVPALWLLLAMLLVPLIFGISGMIIHFDNNLMIWTITYFILASSVFLTTIPSCPHCAMREICPLSFYKK